MFSYIHLIEEESEKIAKKEFNFDRKVQLFSVILDQYKRLVNSMEKQLSELKDSSESIRFELDKIKEKISEYSNFFAEIMKSSYHDNFGSSKDSWKKTYLNDNMTKRYNQAIYDRDIR